MMMAARFRGAEEEPGSEEEEEGPWEYDSTWEEDGDEEEERGEEGHREPEEEEEEKKKPGRKGSAEAAEGTQEPGKPEKLRPPRKGRPPAAKQAFGGQEWRRPNRSTMSFGRYKSASRRNWMAARDMQRYRHHYPDLEETDTETKEEEMWNLSFYKNEISFVPHGLHIEDLLETWQHDYAVMEENHSYIQWLFPLREPGMNWRAKLLTCREIQAFRKSKEVMDRFVRAYKLMLGFYGIEMINEETGELRRADNYRERFWNLNQYTHNNLRITRILKCLGEMGKEHYQVHLVKFFLTETLVKMELPRVMKSALDYFMFTIRNKQARRELVHFAWEHFQPKHEFVWGPRKKLREFRPRSAELPNNLAPKEEPEPAQAGAAEGVEQNKSQVPNETCKGENVADRSNDNVKRLPDCDRGAVETQSMSKHKTSEETEGANPGLASRIKAEGEDDKEDCPSGKMEPGDMSSPGDCSNKEGSPRGKMEPGEIGPTGDCSNKEGSPSGKMEPGEMGPSSSRSSGGTDGECLKESKKRKFEMNKPSRESVGLSRSPTEIEKISSNLEEVVINQEGPESLPLAEKSEGSIREANGRDGQDLKEVDLVSAVVKRRKVDEIVPDKKIETAAKPGAEVTSFESQILNFKVPSPKETAEGCPAGAKVSDVVPSEVQNDCGARGGVDASVNSETTTANSGLPSGDSEPDTSNGCIATSMTEGEGSRPSSALIASTKQEEGGSGCEEASMKEKDEQAAELGDMARATKNATPLAKPDAERSPR